MATMNAIPPPPQVQLEEFIFRSDSYTSEQIPRNLPRAVVARFLRERIDGKTPLRPLRQAEKVVEFYDLQEICAHFQALLQGEEAVSDDLLREIVVDRSLALVCAPAELAFARQYYFGLIGRASTSAEFQELVWLNDAVSDPEGTVRLRERIAARRAVAPREDYQARLEFLKLEEIENLKLSRSEKAYAVKERILNIPERSNRIEEEIKMYLTLEYGYLEFLQPWAARRLRREIWGEQPGEQFIYKEDTRLRAEVADAFYRMSDDLERFPHIEPESLPSLRVRCLRAAAFFGKHPSLEDFEYVRTQAGRQFDTLSNE